MDILYVMFGLARKEFFSALMDVAIPTIGAYKTLTAINSVMNFVSI